MGKHFAAIAAFLICASAWSQTKIPASAFQVVPMGYNYDGDGPIYIFAGDTAGTIVKIRLNGCDAPEREKPGICTKTQDGATESKDFTENWLAGPGTFWLDTLDDRDQYNRIVGRIWKNNGTDSQDLTYQTLWNGWTWYVYDAKTPAKSRKLYSAAHEQAKDRKVGVFADTWEEPAVHPRKWKKKYGFGNNYSKWKFWKKKPPAIAPDGE